MNSIKDMKETVSVFQTIGFMPKKEIYDNGYKNFHVFEKIEKD